jgi:hypothetical protein
MEYGRIRYSVPNAIVTQMTITEVQPGDAGVPIIMDRLHDRNADCFRRPDHCRTDQGEDIVQVNEIRMPLPQQSFESPHALR